MAGGRMEDNAIGIDLTRLRQAPGCGKPLANLPAPKRSKLAAMLGVLLDMSLKGRFIRDSRRRAIDIGCGQLVDRLPEPRSEGRRVGKGGVSKCRSWWSPD